ncbi:MAG: hypothetical protein HQ463_00460 [Bacteroidetes bacterium]|nr:hypothetical protein [Bacteroidota bacterium]
MKKLILIASFIFIAFEATSQSSQQILKNRRGIAILPQIGEYAIGFGANPVFNYFGNMFNGSGNNSSPSPTFATPNQNLFFKYMKSNNTAYRVYFRLGLNSNTIKSNVVDKTSGALVNSTVVDVQKTKNNTIGLGFGIEKRKGATRLQGIYGCEAFINNTSGFDSKYTFGNKIENEDSGKVRTTLINSASNFTIGLRGFVGIEYFIAPKISIGGELGYGASFIFRSSAENTIENYDKNTTTLITKKTTVNPKSNSISLDTDNYNGIIKVLFYF